MLNNDITKALGVESYTVDNNVNVWLNCYNGNSYWLQDKYNTSDRNNIDEIQSLNLCAGIPSELARLTVMELKSSVDDDIINGYYQAFLKHIRKFTEHGLALGGIIVKPYVESFESKKIEIDIVPADQFIILGFTSFGAVNHAVFIDRIKKQDRKGNPVFFTRLEEHLINDVYVINNTAYISDRAEELGDKTNLGVISEWENIEPSIKLDDRNKPLFAYFKNPQANNLDLNNFEGISCFARALSLIQDADEQYQRLMWEFKGSELAIDADITVFKKSGEIPVGKERLFRNLGLDLGGNNDSFYNVFSPTIRDQSILNGLNNILRKIEFACGLAYGTISETEYSAKTATEIKMSQQRSYSTVIDIQNELQDALEEFAEIIEYWLIKLKLPVSKEWGVSFDFDDSLVVDTTEEQKIRLQEVASGITSAESYLKWRYGATGEKIEDMMPRFNESFDDIAEEE
ncbi:phage portal protein [Anaerococcus cruorum]|uniref:Phage portal protein n=1 Tax=Anaerococcus cruorum TaxID=3115617 RepID=A0ABW9MWD0_9FIRM